jgi:hypothetical protein
VKKIFARVFGQQRLVQALVVFFSILLPVTLVTTWAHWVVLNDNGWHRSVDRLASQPAITAALSAQVTNELATQLDLQRRIAQLLPARAEFLAAPAVDGLKGYVQEGVAKVVGSPQFVELWIRANGFAHDQLVALLRGKSRLVTTTGDQVTLNLVPLLNASLQQIQGFVSGIIGKPITLPTISPSESPAEACKKIGAAINRPLPPTCGQIPLFPADKLTAAQRIVRVFDRLVVVLLILTPIVAALALLLSRRRRRTLLQLTAGGVLGLVVMRRIVFWLQNTLVNAGKPQAHNVRASILRVLLHTPFLVSLWVIVGLTMLFVITLIAGPYGWAIATRRWMDRVGGGVAQFAGVPLRRADDFPVVAWMKSHLEILMAGGVVVAVVLVLLVSFSFVGLLVLAGLTVLYEVGLWRRARKGTRLKGDQGPSSGGGDPVDALSSGKA